MLDAYAALREPAAAAYAEWQRPIRPRIDLAWDTSALAAGAGRTRAALEAEAESRGAAVDLGRVHGYGLQWLQPLAQITWPDGAAVLYGPVTPDKVGLLLAEATGRAGAAAELALGVIAGERPGLPPIGQHPYLACEGERRLLGRIGRSDPGVARPLPRDGWLPRAGAHAGPPPRRGGGAPAAAGRRTDRTRRRLLPRRGEVELPRGRARRRALPGLQRRRGRSRARG